MISKEEILKIASLSRIYLEEHEKDKFSKDLEDILNYIAKLENLDVSNVEPTSHVVPVKNVLREDSVKPSLSQEDVLKISKTTKENSFQVPQIIEE